MTGKRSSSTLSFFSLTDQFARKNSQINRSPHPPILASSKRKFDPDVIVQGHVAKKEKQMSFGTIFFFSLTDRFFAKGLKSTASTVASVHQKQFDWEVTGQGERSKKEKNGSWVPTLPFFTDRLPLKRSIQTYSPELALPKWKFGTQVICQGRGAKRKQRETVLQYYLSSHSRLQTDLKKKLRSAAFTIARVTQKTIWPGDHRSRSRRKQKRKEKRENEARVTY